MNEILFDGKREVSDQEIIDKVNYFIKKAEEAGEFSGSDEKENLQKAIKLRNELRIEYKNNKLDRISKFYDRHELFSRYYKPAVSDAFLKISGKLTYNNLSSFLSSVKYYMRHYLRKKFSEQIN